MNDDNGKIAALTKVLNESDGDAIPSGIFDEPKTETPLKFYVVFALFTRNVIEDGKEMTEWRGTVLDCLVEAENEKHAEEAGAGKMRSDNQLAADFVLNFAMSKRITAAEAQAVINREQPIIKDDLLP